VQQLGGVVPGIANNVGWHFLNFTRYQFKLINSALHYQSRHQVARNFCAEPLRWYDAIAPYLLVSRRPSRPPRPAARHSPHAVAVLPHHSHPAPGRGHQLRLPSRVPGKICLADQRGPLENSRFRRQSTFSFGAFQSPYKQAFGRLYGFYKATLAGSHAVELAVADDSCSMLLPITGTVAHSNALVLMLKMLP
jgi:hypothetical protein